MLKIKKTDLPSFFNTISQSMPVYAPIRKNGITDYGFYDQTSQIDIDTLKTAKSPKDVFFPQSETMMKFCTDGKNITIQDVRKPQNPFLVFGVRACDYKAFGILDNVFLAEPVDTYYKMRRDAGVVFTLSCKNPQESCFCTVFGINPTEPDGDAICWADNDYLYLNPNTQKGQRVLDLVSDLTQPCDQTAVNQIKKNTDEALQKLPLKNLDLTPFKPQNLNKLFNLPVWEELSQACLGCGACTFVCPTCQCFDIRDFKTNEGVNRFRCWDSCMYSDFTQMAAENPRTTQMQRYRQRFMHKLVYYPSQYGEYSCVGCGRCVTKCPQRLNIAKVIKRIGRDRND